MRTSSINRYLKNSIKTIVYHNKINKFSKRIVMCECTCLRCVYASVCICSSYFGNMVTI